MRNMLKADLFRIFKGKGVYITLIIFIALIILAVVNNSASGMGVNIEGMATPEAREIIHNDDGSIVVIDHRDHVTLTGKTAPLPMAQGTDILIYILLPFIVFIAAADFSHGTVKNLMGTSRIKYYLSKLILTGISCVLIFLLYILLSITAATIMNGFGGTFDLQFILDIAKIYLPQIFLLFAYSCIGVFLAFTFKRTAILNSIYIAFSVVPAILIMILTNINQKFAYLMNYDLLSSMKLFGYPDNVVSHDLARAMLLGLAYILITTVGGILLFRKSEIK